MKALAILGIVVVALGCASGSSEMDRVRVTNNPDVVRGCKFLGNVHFDETRPVNPKDADDLVRKKVVELGGNVGYVVATPRGNDSASPASYTGEAYSCRAIPPMSPATAH